MLDTFDGRVRRTGARLTRTGVNGRSIVAWQPRGGGSHLTARLRKPVSFAWDLPDGPLQQVVRPGRLACGGCSRQADAEEQFGSLLDILDDRGQTVARLRIESGRARLPMSRHAWQPLPTMVTLTGLRGYEDVYERLVPVIESRPGIEPCPEGLHGVMLRQLGVPERGDGSFRRLDLAPTVRADVGARQIHRALLRILVANEPGLRAQSRHGVPPRLPRGRPAHALAARPDQARVSIRRRRALRRPSSRGWAASPARRATWTCSSSRSEITGRRSCRRHGRRHGVPGPGTAAGAPRALVEALDSERYQRLLSEWQSFLEQPGPSEPEAPNAGRLLADVVSRRAWRLSRRIAGSAETIDEHTERVATPRGAHRRQEAALPGRRHASLLRRGSDLERILGALKKLQRVLGDFNDAHVQEERLLECGQRAGRRRRARGRPACPRAAGRASAANARERLRGQIVDALARFRARDTRSACRRAFKSARAAERAR